MLLLLLRGIARVANRWMWVACLFVAGCAPRDPLDREVKAHNPAELKAWLHAVETEVGPSLGGEIRQVFSFLVADTPRFKQPTTEFEMQRAGDPLCRRVNGRRLREVMIEGYSSAIETLSLQNGLESENLLRLSAVVDLEREEAFRARVDEVRAGIVRREERIRSYRDRIEQLRKPGS